jgi:hypothetical protein
LIALATKEGITPLEVLLRSMRAAWKAGDKETACRYAKDAAPFVHPRYASIDMTAKAKIGITVNIVRFGDQAIAA